MTVANTSCRTAVFGSGAGGQEVPFLFPINDTSDLTVIKRVTATGVETVLAETTNYTVSIEGDTGGTVTTVTAIPTSAQIHVIRKTLKTQSLDLVSGDSFSSERVESALDRNMRVIIENADALDRTLRFPDTDPIASIGDMPNSIERAGRYLFFSGATGEAVMAEGTGTQGFQGTQGHQGPQGAQGARGYQGTQGSTGAQGSMGSQGSTGATGAQGNQGVVGAQGAQGASGSQGSTGSQGDSGPQGSQGVTGNQGAQGSAGAQGSTGVQGSTGDQGVQGEQGAVGADGLNYVGEWDEEVTYDPNDAVGHEGTTYICILESTDNEPPNATYWNVLSLQGTQGSQGVTGATGPQGTQGVAGSQGATGAQGSQGNVGSQGPTGPQGNQGATGVQGATGSQGSQGNIGAQGSTGATGSQGNQGAAGVQGAAGSQGEQGATGSLGAALASAVTIEEGGYFQIGEGTKDDDLTGIVIDDTEIVGQTSGTDNFYLRANGTAKFEQVDIIDTPQIVDNAVTVASSAYTAAKIDLLPANTWKLIQSLNLDVPGDASTFIFFTCIIRNAAGTYLDIQGFELRRFDGVSETVIYSDPSLGAYGLYIGGLRWAPLSISCLDTPAQDNYTYRLYMYATHENMDIYHSLLLSLIVKK